MAKVLKVYDGHNNGDHVAAPPTANDTLVGAASAQTLTNKTLSAPVVSANAPVSAGGASLTLTAATHGGKTMIFDAATGVTFTLPAATGTGVRFRFVVTVTVTSNQHRIDVVGNDAMFGVALVAQDGGDTIVAFEAGADADRINMNGTTTGGIKGTVIELEDVATDTWAVEYKGSATGTEATPFVTGAVS
jgi:hypothetical protein